MEGEQQGGIPESKSSWVNLTGAAATKLRSVVPDLTTAKRACAASYGYACRASKAVKGAINVPIEASWNRIGSLAPDPQTQEVFLKAVTGAAADEALKAASSFVPGGHPLYRITKAGASELSKAYSRKGAQQLEKMDGAAPAAVAAEGPAGSSALEIIERKLQEMSSEVAELKLQNQMLREKVSKLSAANQPLPQLTSPLQRPPPPRAPEVVPAWQMPEDVIRVFMTNRLKGRDLQSVLLIPKFAGSDHEKKGK